MWSSRYWMVLLAAVIFMHSVSQGTSESMPAGLVPLLYSLNKDHSSCHECLVTSAGFQKIYLRHVGNRFRLYWIEGYTDILSSILLHCNSRRKCAIYSGLPANYNIDYPKMTTTKHRSILNMDEIIEKDLFSLTQCISHEVVMPRALKGISNYKHDLSRFIRKKKTSILLLPGHNPKWITRDKKKKEHYSASSEK